MGLAMVTYTILNIYLYQQQEEELDRKHEWEHELQIIDKRETEIMLEETMKNPMSPGERAKFYNRSKSLDLSASRSKKKPTSTTRPLVRLSEITESQLNASQHSIIHQ